MEGAYKEDTTQSVTAGHNGHNPDADQINAETSQLRIKALEAKNEALHLQIQALKELSRSQEELVDPLKTRKNELERNLRDLTRVIEELSNQVEEYREKDRRRQARESGDGRRGRGRPRGSVNMNSAKMQAIRQRFEERLSDMMNSAGERFNKATIRGLTNVLMQMRETGTTTLNELHETYGGAKVSIVRHTGLLKTLKLIGYEGSRKKGHYVLTPQGQKLMEEATA